MKNYIKTLSVAVLTLASSVSATAQSSKLQAELEPDGVYYMYSVGHGLFVNGAGAWKTQAILSSTPMKVKMEESGDKWTICRQETPISGSTKTDCYFKRETAAGADMIFVDGNNTHTIKWKITDMGEHQYKIQAPDAAGEKDACMGVRSDLKNTQTNSCVYGPYFNQSYNEKDCLWAFVKAEDYTEDMKPLISKTAVRNASAAAPFDFQHMLQSPTCDNTNGWDVDNTLVGLSLLKFKQNSGQGFSTNSIEFWKGNDTYSPKTGRVFYRLSSLPAGTYRLTAKIFEQDVDASTITTRPDFFFGDTRMEFTEQITTATEKVFYAQHKADGDIDFGFTLPEGKIWVIIDDIELEAVGGPNAILTNVEENATYSGNVVTAGNTCKNYDLVDDKYGMNNIATAFTAENVTYNRQLTSGTTTTVCLPFSLTAEEAAELGSFYTLKGLANNTLSFEIASVVEANKPYLFVPKTEAFNSFTNKTIAITPESLSQVANDNNATMLGTLRRTTLRSSASETLYAYNDGNFVKISSTADAYLPAFRAYISVTTSIAAKLAIRLDDKTTGISMGTAEGNADATIYTVDGVKVSEPISKGVYIKNGKKFVVK